MSTGADGVGKASTVPVLVSVLPGGVSPVDRQRRAGHTDPGSHDPRVMLLITASPALRDAFLGTAAGIEHPLAAVIADRTGTGQLTARVLAASVAAAVRVALGQWARPAAEPSAASGLITVSGSLAELLRAALAPLTPALDAAGQQGRSDPPHDRQIGTRQ